MSSNPDIFERFVDWVDTTPKIDDLELMTLKCHLMVEDALKYLLSAKLRPRKDPEEFAAKIGIRTFRDLAVLALVDEDDEHGLRSAVIALNEARNKMSHRIDHPEFLNNVRDFVQQVNALPPLKKRKWPSTKADQLASVRQAADETINRILHSAIMHHTGPPPPYIKTKSRKGQL